MELIENDRLWMKPLQRHLIGEKCTGANPTVRAKFGINLSMVVVGKGVPLRITRYDMKTTKTTLQSIVVHRPKHPKLKQHMCTSRRYVTIFQKSMNCYWTEYTNLCRHTSK